MSTLVARPWVMSSAITTPIMSDCHATGGFVVSQGDANGRPSHFVFSSAREPSHELAIAAIGPEAPGPDSRQQERRLTACRSRA